MGVLDRLSPTQQKIVKFGAPVAVAAALFLRRPGAPDDEGEGDEGEVVGTGASTTGYLPPVVAGGAANTAAIDSGQLTGFLSSLTAGLQEVRAAIDALENQPVAPSSPPPAPTPEAQAGAQQSYQAALAGITGIFSGLNLPAASAVTGETAAQRTARLAAEAASAAAGGPGRTTEQIRTSLSTQAQVRAQLASAAAAGGVRVTGAELDKAVADVINNRQSVGNLEKWLKAGGRLS